MVVAEHARDLPRSIFVLPQVNELPFTVPDLRMSRMMKPMRAHLDRAVTLHVIDLERAGNELARSRSTNILFD